MISSVLLVLVAGLHRAVALTLLPMAVPTPTPTRQPDAYPSGGQGFAASIVPALFGIAVIALFAIWLTSKPKRRR